MSFSVTVLGTSSALPTSDRFPSAQVVNLSERIFLFDCGEGTQMQLRKFKVRFSRINHIFISHLHADHYLGLFGLLSSFALMGRKHALHIYCVKELKSLIDFQFKYFFDSIGYEIVYHFLPNCSSLIYEDNSVKVSTFILNHRIQCNGFIVEEKPKEKKIRKEFVAEYKPTIKEIVNIKKGDDYVREEGLCISNNEITIEPERPRKYVYCSDTSYIESIIDVIRNADLLYHEATFAAKEQVIATATQHSTTLDAANIASKSNAKTLLIGHFSSRYKKLEPLLDEARSIFPQTILAKEGLRIDL
jgi:ribonuclease Z